MNKAELIAAIAEKTGNTTQEVTHIFSTTFDIIANAMAKEEKITIPGFGNFQAKIRAERKGRNPATGQEMIIPKSTVANFKPATQLKDILNNQK